MAAVVQSKQGLASAATTLTLTLGSGTTSGNTLAVAVFVWNDAGTAPTISSVKLGTTSAAQQGTTQQPSSNAGAMSLWAIQSIASGQTSVVVTIGAATGNVIAACAFELSGMTSGTLLDQAASAGTETNAWSSGNVTTTSANEIALGIFGGWDNTTFSPAGPSSPWTNTSLLTSATEGGLIAEAFFGSRVLNSTTTLAYSGTGGNAVYWNTASIWTLTASSAVAGAAALSAAGSMTAAGDIAGAASLAASGSMTAAATQTLQESAALSAAGSMTAAATQTLQEAAALAASGSVSAAATSSAEGSASLSAAGSLAAAATVIVPFPQSILDLQVQLELPQQVSLPPLGVYRGPLGIRQQNGVAGTAGQGTSAYETFIGRSVTYALDYMWNTPSSTAYFTSGELGASNNANTDAGTAVTGWAGNLGGRTLMLAIPACIGVTAGAGATTWAQEAAGTSDTYWTALGNTLISAGLGSAVLRIGREFNGNWYNWSIPKTGDSAANYIAGYQHVVTLLRGLTGASFQFQWNPYLDPGVLYLANVMTYYPGNGYVDSIGLDAYDWGAYTSLAASPYGRSMAEQSANWVFNQSNTMGIQQWANFAQARNRPLGFPEWGLQLFLSSGNYLGGADDPYWITQMAAVFAALGSRCAVSAMWEDDGQGVFDTDSYSGRVSGLTVPQSRAQFLSLYGPGAVAEQQQWVDITPFVYNRGSDPVTITRGRPDESPTVNPQSAAMEWNNRDGRFSPENPGGVYYPGLTRNTPVRVSVPNPSTYLRFADDNLSWCAGIPATEITGDIDIRLDLQLDSYVDSILASKAGLDVQSWILWLNGNGTLEWEHWNSTPAAIAWTTKTTLPLGRIAIRVTMQPASGVYTLYTAPTIAGPWTQVEVLNGAVTSLAASPGVAIAIGDNPSLRGAGFAPSSPLGYYGLQGKVYGLQVLSGVGGTATVNPDFTSVAAGTTSFADAAGTAWALYGTSEISERRYRFHGECSSLPQRWDQSGTDVWVPVQAGGVVRRKGQGSQPLDSAMKRGYARLTGALAPVAYWPCEDGTYATQIASGLPGGVPMLTAGSPKFAADSGFLCSNPIPQCNSAIWQGTVPPYTSGTDIILRFLMHIPAAGTVNATRIMRVYTTGTVNEFSLYYGTGGGLGVAGYRPGAGAALFDSGVFTFNVNNEYVRVSMELRQSGSNINWSLAVLPVGASAALATSGSIAGTVGRATQVWVDPYADVTDTAIGHISVQSTWATLFDLSQQLAAWQGEAAGYRFARLCSEENVAARVYGYPAASVVMGAQIPQTFSQLIQECETADTGMTYEPRETLGLGYRTLASMTNQAAAVTLTYTLAELASPLEPAEDDQLLRNDITVQQSNNSGSSARSTKTAGKLSVAAPPAGTDRYDTSIPVNLASDSQLLSEASWLLHMGTVNEPRYPVVALDLARPEITALYDLLQDAKVGDFIDIASPPPWLPPGDIKQIVSGTKEVLGGYIYRISWNCAPELPYETGLVAGATVAASDARADTDGSALYAPVTSAATSLQVATLGAGMNYALWTTAAGDFPLDIIVGGERITVTAITGTSSPQAFTVTRSVNGVVKAHLAGEAVSLYSPAIVALT